METMKIYMGRNKASLPDGAVGATAGFRGGGGGDGLAGPLPTGLLGGADVLRVPLRKPHQDRAAAASR